MVDVLKAVKELISEFEKAGPMSIAVLALIVALSAIWILGGKS